MKNFFANHMNRIDGKIYYIVLLPMLFLVLTYPAMLWLPIKYAYENSLLENFQLIVLGATIILCIKAKVDKKFFYSMALLTVIIFLREINCGRTVFFAIEGVENAFYPLKEIKYGYLVNPLYITFMAASGLYFIWTKSYKVLFKYIKKAKISVYCWLFLIIGVVFAHVGEKSGSFVLEEMTESAMYLSFLALIYLHGFNKEYIEAVKED